MKILHIATGFPLSFQGGITNYVRSLAQSQHDSNHNITVMGDADDEKFDFNYVQRFTETIAPFYLGALDDKQGLSLLDEYLKKEMFDIIHIHMPLGLDWNLYDIIKPYKYVVSLHDYFYICPRIQMIDKNKNLCHSYDEEKCNTCISKLEQYKLCRGALKVAQKIPGFETTTMPFVKQDITVLRHEKFQKLLENAKMVFPVSKRVQEIYMSSGFKANYHVMYIGNISAENFKTDFKMNTQPRKIKIIMLGSLTYYKGAELLLEFAHKLDKDKFEIHFWGRPLKYEDAILKEGIISHGPYMQKMLPEILSDADFGFVLSVWEDNGPQVVMEFLNNRVPVIGTKMGGIIDFIDGSNGYLFNPYDNEEKDAAIHNLNNITLQDIYEMKHNIKRTTLPSEHYNTIMDLYNKILK